MHDKVFIMCSWCGWENPCHLTAYAARGPRDAFFQEHMKYTYNPIHASYILFQEEH